MAAKYTAVHRIKASRNLCVKRLIMKSLNPGLAEWVQPRKNPSKYSFTARDWTWAMETGSDIRIHSSTDLSLPGLSSLATEPSPLAIELSSLATELSSLATELSSLATELSSLATELNSLATESSSLATELSPHYEHTTLDLINLSLGNLNHSVS